MDWSNLSLSHAEHLPMLLAICAVVAVCAFVLGRRHTRATRVAATVLRVTAFAALGVVLLGPVVTVTSEKSFKPKGVWRLVLPGADVRPSADVSEFHETGDAFVARVRDSLAGEHPPEFTEVHTTERAAGVQLRDRIQALGIPCDAFYPDRDTESLRPVLTGIDAPVAIKPGEPFQVKPGVAGPASDVRMYLDGSPLELADGEATVHSDRAGVHVIETVLLDDEGTELQRTGHVFRVGDKPVALALGLTGEQVGRASALVPDFEFTRETSTGFDDGDLENVSVVMTSVDALNQINADQAYTLATFTARGGGLYVIGDGAKYVAPEFLNDDVRRLLPVILRKEGKKPPEDDPPVKEEKEKVEIAKVSMVFVLDRSTSMDAPIGNSKITRWDVARKGVIESIKLVEQGGKQGETGMSQSVATRIGVMSFTLSQHWVYETRNVFKHDRNQIDLDLKKLRGDTNYDEQRFNTDVYAAMDAAIDSIKDERSAVKVVVMMTDGGDRPANTLEGKKHSELRDTAIANDINVITVGIGQAFAGASADSLAAQKVIKDLATKPEFWYLPTDAASAKKAHVIFLNAVETAFQAYDDKKEQEEEERQERIKEQEEKENEPENVDVMPGVFALNLERVGEQLFGENALPEPAPKVGWLARNDARRDAAVALTAQTEDGRNPALAFRAYGLGRVAFWGAGTKPEDLGELTGWGDFPAIFAASLRWLMPREQPDIRLVAGATPDGVRILDALEGASYWLRRGGEDIALRIDDDMLRPVTGELPPGSGEIIERIDGDDRSEIRIGDVYVACAAAVEPKLFRLDKPRQLDALKPRELEISENTRVATLPILYLLTALLMLMPIERMTRRRT